MSDECDEAARRLLADAEAAARGSVRRHRVALVDLFLPEAERPSDLQRATMTRLLDGLVDSIEAELRAALPPIAAVGVKALLRAAGLLEDEALIAVLLRRADADRLARVIVAGDEGTGLIETLADDADGAVADAATALKARAAQARDAFLDPLMTPADLPADVLSRLAWAVAAALRGVLAGRDANMRLGAAVEALLAKAATEETEEGCAARLAGSLDAAGRLDGDLVLRAVAAGELTLAVAALGRRARLGTAAVWEMLVDRDRLLVLLATAGMKRDAALGVASLLGADEDLAERAAAFDRLSRDAADAAVAPWRLDPAYRAALTVLDKQR